MYHFGTIILVLLLFGCNENNLKTDCFKISKNDSVLVLTAIKSDSSLLDTNLVKYNRLPFLVKLFADSTFIINKFYFKNKNQVFNYYLIKTVNGTEVISLNSLRDFDSNDTCLKIKKSKIEYLETHLNRINNLFNDKFKTDFIINQIFNNSNSFEKITSYNSLYYNSSKDRVLKMGMTEFQFNKEILELENKLNKPFNNIYFLNDFFILIDAKQNRIKINFYFEEYASKNYNL